MVKSPDGIPAFFAVPSQELPFKQFDKEFGDMVDIGVIHNEDSSCVALLAKSCRHYLPRPDRVVIEELK